MTTTGPDDDAVTTPVDIHDRARDGLPEPHTRNPDSRRKGTPHDVDQAQRRLP